MIRLIAAFFFLTCCCSASVSAERDDKLTEALTAHLTAFYPPEIFAVKKNEPLISSKKRCICIIYNEKGMYPFWVTPSGINKQAAVVYDYLTNAHREGLDPADYEAELLQTLRNSREPDDRARLDTLLTFNLVKYIHDLSYGQVKFYFADPDLFAEAGNRDFNPLQALEKALTATDLGIYLETLPPQHHYYSRLKLALAHYRQLNGKTAGKIIPAGPSIYPGKTDERLEAIHNRLSITGDLPPNSGIPSIYDAKLVDSVKKFQIRHGLEADGVIGPRTLAALNTPIKDLVSAIRVNMARWRWQTHTLGKSYIMVNIAAFSLKTVRDQQIIDDIPVIVGKFKHQTPIFSDFIQYLEFNPFWNVTPSIARNEELPQLRKNPRYLVERNIRLFSSWDENAVELDSTALDWSKVSGPQMTRYKLRQDPGPWNALGKVKFVFPNHHSVYLHDTPTQGLFRQTARSFSHGCIRVSRPLELALFCMKNQDPGWTLKKIEEIAAGGKRKILKVNPPLPVHITYQTIWFDEKENIHFNRDIYGRDAKLVKLLLD